MHSLTYSSACAFELPLDRPSAQIPPPLMVDIPSHQSRPLDCQVLAVTQKSTPAVIPPSCQNSFFMVNDNSLLFSEQMRGHITQAIQSGWTGSTVKHYSSTINQFIRFCHTECILEHLHFPADEFVLCAFAASSLRKHARTTPCNCLSALKAWHITHNLEWKGSARLQYVLNRLSKVRSWSWRTQVWTGPDPKYPGPGPAGEWTKPGPNLVVISPKKSL